MSRARWAALGAAVAVSLGVGGVAVTNAIVSTGERTAFIPITPCRLFDLRPAPSQVGPRSAPLGPHEVYTVQVTGSNGNCTIPADAIAVAMNVTTVGGTGASYLTIWPSDVAQPLASNLNWVPGSPPTPNKVDVRLSATGSISLYNDVGNVSVLADVVGYYADHNHDDRYYTKTEIENKLNSDIVMSQGLQFVDNGSVVAFPTFQHYSDLMRVPSPDGIQTQIIGPTSQNGVSYGLRLVTYCIQGRVAPAVVSFVNVAGKVPALADHTDSTVRSATGCYVITVNDAVSTSFDMYVSVSGAGGRIDFTSLTATWTPVGLMPASAASASSSEGDGSAP